MGVECGGGNLRTANASRGRWQGYGVGQQRDRAGKAAKTGSAQEQQSKPKSAGDGNNCRASCLQGTRSSWCRNSQKRGQLTNGPKKLGVGEATWVAAKIGVHGSSCVACSLAFLAAPKTTLAGASPGPTSPLVSDRHPSVRLTRKIGPPTAPVDARGSGVQSAALSGKHHPPSPTHWRTGTLAPSSPPKPGKNQCSRP